MCGITGLRPTFGRVSRHGAMALSYSMDKIGPMCRTAEDCDTVLRIISGHDPEDAGSLPPQAAKYRGAPAAGRLRIGWMVNAWKKVKPEIETHVNAARKVLESSHGVSVKNVSLPEGPWETAAGTVISVEGATAFRSLIQSGKVAELSDPLGQIGGYINEELSASDFILAQRIRGVLKKKMDELFVENQVDVLAAASLPVTATRVDANLDLTLTFADPAGGIGNACGLPAIGVPCGFADNHLPCGIQFIGRALDDARVVQAARLFQSRTDWHRKHPKLS